MNIRYTNWIVVFAAFLVLMISSPARATWYVHFIPNETDHIDVTINGDYWMTWKPGQGDVKIALPDKWANLQKIHVLAVGQEGKNASMCVMWDNDCKKQMDFDGKDGENHDVDH